MAGDDRMTGISSLGWRCEKVTPHWRDPRVPVRECSILNGATVLEELPDFVQEGVRWQI
jgi:hypothetical protein